MLVLKGHTNSIQALAYTPDGRMLVSAGDDATVRLWDVRIGGEIAQHHAHSQGVQALCVSPDGASVVTGGHDKQVMLWELASDNWISLFARFEYTINALAFSPDGLYLACGSDRSATDGRQLATLLLREMNTTVERVLEAPESISAGVWSLAFHPDSDALMVGWGNGTTDLLEVPAGDRITQLPRGAAVHALAFSPDGALLATLPGRGVRVWDVRPGGFFPHLTLGEHAERAWTLAFTPNGDCLATGGWDSTVRLWDPHTGAERARFDWQLGRINAVAFAPDGLTAAAGGNAHDIVIWDVD